ncbi:MAG: GHKL domain-containing protein [candidate division Zixibacteria bacterium]|nr:GHKL domain-containing protein [candidate division Zixibacteria bacterium]
MSAEIGHELNNYIGAIQTNIELIDRYITNKDYNRVEKRVKTVMSSFKSINRFIDGLMDLKPMHSSMRLQDINQIIERTVNFIRPQNKYRYIDFTIDLDSSLPAVNVDYGQMEQLLFNLIGNAADAMGKREGEGGNIIIKTFENEKTEMVCFSVIDNGPGMNEEVLNRLLKGRFTTKEYGHGLGLITCQKIVENHEGKIRVDSVLGEGATFTISLPVKH